MNRFTASIGFSALIAVALGMAGCNRDISNTPAAPSADQTAVDNDKHAGHDHSSAELEKTKTELAKLSPEDASAAERQNSCPVTGELLGSMGSPKKVDVRGHSVWICCDGCREELLANPDKYLAKLKKG